MPVPTRFGDYEVLSLLGEGGMGAVYRCRAPNGEQVAVKTLRSGGGDRARALERFAREAGALARLGHANLIGVLGQGEHDGQPFLVMPLVSGRSLQEQLDKGGPLPERDAARLFQTLARALAYAHQHGVLHRDLKPANVIVRGDGEPVLVDFGLVKDAQLDANSLTRSGVHLGTPGFWPPEQMHGQHDRVDARSDVYGLGATLYAALAGQPPYPAGTWAELVRMVNQPPQRLSSVRPELDPGLARICMRCLAEDPAERYPSADALAQALEDWTLGQGPGASKALAGWAVAAGALALVGVLGLSAVLGRESPEPPVSGSGPPPTEEPPDAVSEPPLAPLEELVELEEARDAILAGLEGGVPQLGVPGPVVCFAPRSSVLFSAPADWATQVSARHEAAAVAALFGEGRVVAIGHSDYLVPENWSAEERADAERFLLNCVRWAGGAKPRVGVFWAEDQDPLLAFLEKQGFEVRPLGVGSRLEGLEVVLWRQQSASAVPPDALVGFVAGGGGLVVGDCPWGTQQLAQAEGRNDIRDAYPKNAVLAPMGLAFNRYGGLPAQGQRYRASRASLREALTAFTLREVCNARALPPAREAEALIQLTRAVEALPSRGHASLEWIARTFRPDLDALTVRRGEGVRVGTRGALAIAAVNRRWCGSPGTEPLGLPPAWQLGAPRGEAEGRVLVRAPPAVGSTSTGLYAAPDEELRVELVDGSASGIRVRVGAHRDVLWNQDRYARFPEVSRDWALGREGLRVVSPFGGLIYLEREREGAADARVAISGAYAAPSFSLGQRQTWAHAQRSPGAWGELAGEHVTLILPRELLRGLDDPAAVCTAWDGLLQVGARFAGSRPRGRLRLVCDVQQEFAVTRPTDPASVTELSALVDPDELRRRGSSALGAVASKLLDPDWDVRALREGHVWLLENALRRELGCPQLPASTRPVVQLFAGLLRDFGWEALERVYASYRGFDAGQRLNEIDRLGAFYMRLCEALRSDLEQRFRAADVLPKAAILALVRQEGYPQR